MVVRLQLLFVPCDGCPTEVYVLPRQEIMKLTWYGGRVYDVVLQNIIFEAQLKDGGAWIFLVACSVYSASRPMTFISTFWRVLDTLLIHFRTTLGWSVTVATMPNDPLRRTCWTLKTCISISFAIWNRWTGRLWFGELGFDG